MIESLESRRLFAVVATQDGAGAVLVDGGNANNAIKVVEDAGTVSVYDNTANPDVPIATFTGATAITILGDAKSDDIFFTGNSLGASIFTLSGTDTIVIDDQGTGSSYADGEGDADSLTVLRANNTTLIGGGAADNIVIQESVGTGVTWCYGLGGGDTMTTYAGVNHLFGDGGNDTVIVGASFNTGAGHQNFYDNIETIVFV